MNRPKPHKRQIPFSLPIDLIREIKVAAAESGVYPANVVEEACREHLDRRRQPADGPEPQPAA